MKITLLTVGKTDVKWVAEGLQLYTERLSHYVPFTVRELPALKRAGALSPAQVRDKEGELLLASLKPTQTVVLLDERGTEYRSQAFAARLQRALCDGRELVFAIGGAYGFSEAVYARADGRMALSQMTFSHQMVRVIFAEQLYRAFTILRGEPYHNE
ncbi:MAG: 23S rRNA (pseudouridine(1915)-N(3))-methyltransferase RlmH [Bacteroidales bacterium]|nr:23S rRNA (pseudouridine(1915)-N(3))-methyltransferase RlmH [Bacteroidales bacterium]